MNKVDLKTPAGYDEDFALWSAEQAALIRAGKLDHVDLEKDAREPRLDGRPDRVRASEVLSVRSVERLEVPLGHLQQQLLP